MSMWTYTGFAGLFFATLAIAIEFATASRAMTPVDLSPDIMSAAQTALDTGDYGRPIVRSDLAKDLRAVRLQNGQYLVCGRALSERPDRMTGFSVQLERTANGILLPQRTYIDRKADRLCEQGRIPLLSLGLPSN